MEGWSIWIGKYGCQKLATRGFIKQTVRLPIYPKSISY